MKSYIKPELDVVSVVPEAPIALGDDIIVNPGEDWDKISATGYEYFGYDK